MLSRLNIVSNHLSDKGKGVSDLWEYFDWSKLLTEMEEKVRKSLRELLEKEIKPKLIPYYEKAEFPEFVVKKLQEFGIGDYLVGRPYGNMSSNYLKAAILMELARIDASLATFATVQFGLLADTLFYFGTEDLKDRYLAKVKNLYLIGGWALTEPEFGSDASSLKTTVTPQNDGFVLNGQKRWPGNSNRDLMVVFARNTTSNNVEAFLIENKFAGVRTEKIQNKGSLRMVQNCHIYFDNVFIPKEQKLENVKNFEDVAKLLAHSRSYVPAVGCGIALGVYEAVQKFANERKQFGKAISSFQLTQEKIVRIAYLTQTCLLMTYNNLKQINEEKGSVAKSAMVKAYVSKALREVCLLGREILGGNGIVYDNYVMKALMDSESVFTYEGTYDVNCLVVGRELTGKAAFK